MSRRRNRLEIIEDAFSELTIEDQTVAMRVLNALHRSRLNNGAAIADLDKRTRPAKQLTSQTSGQPAATAAPVAQGTLPIEAPAAAGSVPADAPKGEAFQAAIDKAMQEVS